VENCVQARLTARSAEAARAARSVCNVLDVKRALLALIAVGVLAAPAAASARTVIWSGTHGTPGVFGFVGVPFESVMLSTSAGRVSIKSLQIVMACTDPAGQVRPIAFSVQNSRVRAAMRSNRYTINLTARSNGRKAAVNLRGTLASNGRGNARVRVLGNSRDSTTGELLEECEREVTIAVRRGPR
jgi:hypothetical protein